MKFGNTEATPYLWLRNPKPKPRKPLPEPEPNLEIGHSAPSTSGNEIEPGTAASERTARQSQEMNAPMKTNTIAALLLLIATGSLPAPSYGRSAESSEICSSTDRAAIATAKMRHRSEQKELQSTASSGIADTLFIPDRNIRPEAATRIFTPRTGDLLFMINRPDSMTDAIDAATRRDSLPPYTHVGIAEVTETGTFILEATGSRGVVRTPIADFIRRAARTAAGKPAVAVGRFRYLPKRQIDRAIERAHRLLGLPYDDEFLPDNGKLYCSELVWECFLGSDDSTHLLRSQPMTFRAADGSFPAYWISHFGRLGMEIPEGVEGTNPNAVAQDPAIRILYRFDRSDCEKSETPRHDSVPNRSE